MTGYAKSKIEQTTSECLPKALCTWNRVGWFFIQKLGNSGAGFFFPVAKIHVGVAAIVAFNLTINKSDDEDALL